MAKLAVTEKLDTAFCGPCLVESDANFIAIELLKDDEMDDQEIERQKVETE